MTDSTKLTEYQKQKNKEEMKKHLISFALMIVMTLIAFAIVATNVMDKMFAIPLLALLAIVQVAFQFYYFMHMKDKGHEMASLMMYGGVWAAFLTLMGLAVISWW